MNYDALLLMSVSTYALIGAMKTPVLHPIRSFLTSRIANANVASAIYEIIIRLIAFGIGLYYATSNGADGDLLAAIGWTDSYEWLGYITTAIVIAGGNITLDFAKTLLEKNTNA